MTFLIADTFTRSLGQLTPDQQTAAKTTAFDLQQDKTRSGMSYHALNKAKDPRFASVRVNDDLRVIVHRTPESLLLCYVGHHDDAYRWAERRKLAAHPTTGAMQMVEVRERVEEVVKRIVVPEVVQEAPTEPPLFADLDDETLLAYGVPPEWLADARSVTESGLFDLAEHLPAEAANALLALAVGDVPEVTPPAAATGDPFLHPAAKQRFRIIEGAEELEQALAAPWEQWSVFLHPTQEELVTRDFGGPARVSGSAGTGKTVVAIHRAVHLAEANPHARVLLATFSDQLASHLERKLNVLTRARPRVRERIDVATLVGLAQRLHRARFGEAAKLVTEAELERVMEAAANEAGAAFSLSFLLSEWEHVVDAWQLRDWEAYKSVPRIGRKVRLPESARRAAWSVFELVWKALDERGATTEAGVYGRLARDEGAGGRAAPYDHVVLDEAQDASAAQLLFLSRLVGDRPNGLFFAGDLGQRIFRQPFSWLAVGVDIRGRSRTLKVNYRTSHQIRTAADLLLDERTDDADGETQERRGTISVFDGPEPTVEVHGTEAQERAAVAKWLGAQAEKGVPPQEMAIFVRSGAELDRAAAAAAEAGIPARVLGSGASTASEDRLVIATMHLAKGLEFRSVAVMACDEDVIPSSERLGQAADMVNLQEIHETERHLLYVAITRARDALAVSGVKPGSEFLADLN